MNDGVAVDAGGPALLPLSVLPFSARLAIILGRRCRSVGATARRHPLREG